MAIEASIVVVFGEQEPGSDDIVVVEFDSEWGKFDLPSDNLDSDGNLKSTFDPLDSPVFLLHHSNTLQVKEVKTTDGSVGLIGQNIVQLKSKDVQFVKIDDTASLGYDNVALGVLNWSGNTGVVSLVGGSNLKLIEGQYPCIGKQTFTVTFQKQYQLIPPILNLNPDETYEILVVVYMEVI